MSNISRYRVEHQPLHRQASAIHENDQHQPFQYKFLEPERRIELLTCSLRALPVWSWANVPELKPQVSEGAPTLADDPG